MVLKGLTGGSSSVGTWADLKEALDFPVDKTLLIYHTASLAQINHFLDHQVLSKCSKVELKDAMS